MVKSIGINDIEELILLGDEVLDIVTLGSCRYDDNGYPLYMKYGESKEEQEKLFDLMKKQLDNEEINGLVHGIIRNKNYYLEDVLDYSVDKLLELVAPIKNKIIGIFRNAYLVMDTHYNVDNTITDEYLLALFAMRLRDRMIVFSSQRQNFNKTILKRNEE